MSKQSRRRAEEKEMFGTPEEWEEWFGIGNSTEEITEAPVQTIDGTPAGFETVSDNIYGNQPASNAKNIIKAKVQTTGIESNTEKRIRKAALEEREIRKTAKAFEEKARSDKAERKERMADQKTDAFREEAHEDHLANEKRNAQRVSQTIADNRPNKIHVTAVKRNERVTAFYTADTVNPEQLFKRNQFRNTHAILLYNTEAGEVALSFGPAISDESAKDILSEFFEKTSAGTDKSAAVKVDESLSRDRLLRLSDKVEEKVVEALRTVRIHKDENIRPGQAPKNKIDRDNQWEINLTGAERDVHPFTIRDWQGLDKQIRLTTPPVIRERGNGNLAIDFEGTEIYRTDSGMFTAEQCAGLPKGVRAEIALRVLQAVRDIAYDSSTGYSAAQRSYDIRPTVRVLRDHYIKAYLESNNALHRTPEVYKDITDTNRTLARNLLEIVSETKNTEMYDANLNIYEKDGVGILLLELNNVGSTVAAPALKLNFENMGFKTHYDTASCRFTIWKQPENTPIPNLYDTSLRRYCSIDEYNRGVAQFARGYCLNLRDVGMDPVEFRMREEDFYERAAQFMYIVGDTGIHPISKLDNPKMNEQYAKVFLFSMGLDGLSGHNAHIYEMEVIPERMNDQRTSTTVIQLEGITYQTFLDKYKEIENHGLHFSYNYDEKTLTVSTKTSARPFFENTNLYKEPDYNVLDQEYAKSAAETIGLYEAERFSDLKASLNIQRPMEPALDPGARGSELSQKIYKGFCKLKGLDASRNLGRNGEPDVFNRLSARFTVNHAAKSFEELSSLLLYTKEFREKVEKIRNDILIRDGSLEKDGFQREFC